MNGRGIRDAVVVGAGLSGLVAALRLARGGASVTLVSKGAGGLQLSQGTLDVLGYAPDRVLCPYEALPGFAAEHPDHPYASLSAAAVREAIAFTADAVGPALLGAPGDANLQLPTAVGAIRPTAVAQPSMMAADLAGTQERSFAVVGLRRLKDFPPSLIAGNLARTIAPGGSTIAARPAWVDLEARAGEHDTSGLTFARTLDDPRARERLARLLAGAVEDGETVLLPAVLGLDDGAAHAHLEALIGHPVAEVPLPPPGIPGLRLFRALSRAARDAGVRFVDGSRVVGKVVDGDRLSALVVAETGRDVEFRARSFVFAPGGFESGSLAVDSYGVLSEVALGLPLTLPSADGLISADFWASDRGLFQVGVRADEAMRATDALGVPVYSNLHVAGGILAGASRWREKSGEGIAAASALVAADHIIKEAK